MEAGQRLGTYTEDGSILRKFRLVRDTVGTLTAGPRKTDHTRLARIPALSAPECRELATSAAIDGKR
jgi:hypothetical protein